MEQVKNFFVDLLMNKGMDLLYAIIAVAVGLLVIKIVLKIMKSILSKSKIEKITQSFLISIFRFIFNVVLILIVAQIIGIPITGMVALISTAGLAVGLALQDSLSNLANGIVIISTKPFREGDFININGVEGNVKNIHMLTTAIVTLDNKLIVLPNSTIVTSNIINYNILGKRRVDFTFSVAYESDIKKVTKIIEDVIYSDGRVYLDPKPFISLNKLNDSSLDFFVNCWCDSEDYWSIYYYVMDKVFNEFKKNGISVPYNQMEVRVRKDVVKMPFDKTKLQERKEKIRLEKRSVFDIGRVFESVKESSIKKKISNNEVELKPATVKKSFNKLKISNDSLVNIKSNNIKETTIKEVNKPKNIRKANDTVNTNVKSVKPKLNKTIQKDAEIIKQKKDKPNYINSEINKSKIKNSEIINKKSGNSKITKGISKTKETNKTDYKK